MSETKSQTRSVTKFEARLLTILRGIVRLDPIEPALPFVFDKMPPPDGIGADCLALVCESMAKGCILFLARAGGWRRERFLRNGKAAEGRLWERSLPAQAKLRFGNQSLEFLLWLTAHHAVQSKPWQPVVEQWTVADQLLLFLAYDALRDTEAGPAWQSRPAFQNNMLCRLFWPEDFDRVDALPDCSQWVIGIGSAILESLQEPLAERWLAVEFAKRGTESWQRQKELAESQDQTLDELICAADAAGRRDLLRFIIRAAAKFCRPSLHADDLLAGLRGAGPNRLAMKYDIQKRSAVLPRALVRLSQWERQCRGIGYLDEGYPAAQFFLAEWEHAGAADALPRATNLLRQLEPIAMTEGGASHEPSLSHSRQ